MINSQIIITMTMAFLIITIVITAYFSSLASAYDLDPPQDLCVAVEDSNTSVLMNGKACKDPKLATADDFFASGFNESGPPIPNYLGFAVNILNVNRMPGLNTLGISIVRADLEPFGLISPHIHPRGNELILVLEGILYVGFTVPDPGNPFKSRLFEKILNPGDVFVIPQSLIHVQYNLGTTNTTALSCFNSQNPGVHMIPFQLFGSNPSILDDVLVKGFRLDKKVVEHLRAQFSRK
ncbi:putative germin-like protein 2-1 [Nicotiana sylvestris]|uniref:Germin-like protein n=1 Tax=Nicotiana sylvestris TaxID=4096 RepID=A0A1U7VWV2_NICSY|nr:PREDICTED: putative germin-like protein 2-1 [Nicotiana sylvestris]